jgi:hypothetical protein
MSFLKCPSEPALNSSMTTSINAHRLLPYFLSLLALAGPAAAAPAAPDTAERGSLFSGTVRAKFPRDNNTSMKGLVVTLDGAKTAHVCYDTDLMRLSLAWTGDFLKFGNYMKEIVHPQPPEVAGAPVFGTRPGPGWARGGSFTDPRPRQQGPLPKDWAHYRGLYRHGDQVVLHYTVGDCNVLEQPGVIRQGNLTVFTRTLNLGRAKEPLALALCDFPKAAGQAGADAHEIKGGRFRCAIPGTTNWLEVALSGDANDAKLRQSADGVRLELPAGAKPRRVTVLMAVTGQQDNAAAFDAALKAAGLPADLVKLTKGGPPRWNVPVVTQGKPGAGDAAYVVDVIAEPLTNPWNAKTFFGGFDFLPDGRAAICAFHGDVWTVSGLDEKLEKLTWRRFATGLFQPLGLKVADGLVYVLGRDQITRLHDVNQDGEADYYENFNNDCVVTPNYHEFSLDLHTDRAGNFYYAKGSPWSPDVSSPHQGTVLKVSKDGSKLEVFASGLRAPNGSAMSPRDEFTVSDNQGHWMPASKLNLVKRGGFYGMMPAAQRELTLARGGTNLVLNPSDPQVRAAFKIPAADGAAPLPAAYDEPIAWLPMSMDNSSGGQVWVTSDQWGPFKDHLLFMSYGRGTLFHVMLQEVNGVTQAAMARFPFKFNTGISRGRTNPRDGQVYLCGMRGWQCDGQRDGGFYRVRYTGKPVRAPLAFRARRNGVEITFTDALDPASAADAANYAVEQWNYKYSGNYGSPDFSVADSAQKRRDKLEVKSARLGRDGKTVFLELSNIQPCDQLRIKATLKAADGTELTPELHATIHKTEEALAVGQAQSQDQ